MRIRQFNTRINDKQPITIAAHQSQVLSMIRLLKILIFVLKYKSKNTKFTGPALQSKMQLYNDNGEHAFFFRRCFFIVKGKKQPTKSYNFSVENSPMVTFI